MTGDRASRLWHGATAAVTAFALGLQLALVIAGVSALVPEESPTLGTRLARLISYFTIDTNILVLVTAFYLVREPARDGRVWRVVRLDAIAGIAVTGIVHWFLLRPLLHLTGWSYAADKLLHVVVPLLAVVGWAVFGPRPRISWRVIWLSLMYPLVWLAYTLVSGRLTGWYPYPFLDATALGAGQIFVVCLGIFALVVLISVLLLLFDRRLRAAPAPRNLSAPGDLSAPENLPTTSP